jgi:hypothetical protein
MQSLRRRRLSDTRSIKRQPPKLEKKPTIRKSIRKSTVDDKMKERMSLRYTEIFVLEMIQIVRSW